jgi:hypothetical protein
MPKQIMCNMMCAYDVKRHESDAQSLTGDKNQTALL